MRSLLTLILLTVTPTLASAACFEDIGCTDGDRFTAGQLRRLSCENLWFTRNTIYDENGLCFRTARARAQFDNSDCFVDDPAAVRLSSIERANIDRIVQAERAKGCR